MSATVTLIRELEHLACTLSENVDAASEVCLTSVAKRIAETLGVRSDEVAILGVSTRRKHLHFIAPEALKNVGFIPLSSTTALAARTARDSRPEIDNHFATARHVTVFEGVKINSESVAAIQKMISAPILSDGRVIGVIQVSRKGPDPASAGPDFTADELGRVLALAKPLGKLLLCLAVE